MFLCPGGVAFLSALLDDFVLLLVGWYAMLLLGVGLVWLCIPLIHLPVLVCIWSVVLSEVGICVACLPWSGFILSMPYHRPFLPLNCSNMIICIITQAAFRTYLLHLLMGLYRSWLGLLCCWLCWVLSRFCNFASNFACLVVMKLLGYNWVWKWSLACGLDWVACQPLSGRRQQ